MVVFSTWHVLPLQLKINHTKNSKLFQQKYLKIGENNSSFNQ